MLLLLSYIEMVLVACVIVETNRTSSERLCGGRGIPDRDQTERASLASPVPDRTDGACISTTERTRTPAAGGRSSAFRLGAVANRLTSNSPGGWTCTSAQAVKSRVLCY